MKEQNKDFRIIEVSKTAEGKSEVRIVPCKLKDLANFYNVSCNTLRRRLKIMEKEIGKRNGHFFTIPQVTTILRELGIPSWVEID
jgi:hypothetical protein